MNTKPRSNRPRFARFWTTSRTLLAAATILLAASVASAVKPQTWLHQSEEDFTEGAFDNTVINSYGELTLGRQLKPVSLGAPVETITGMTVAGDGQLYVATMPDAKIYRVANHEAKVYCKLPEALGTLTAIATDAKGNLLLGCSTGKQAKLLRLAPGEKTPQPVELFTREGVKNIWAIASTDDGTLYLGTGPKAQIFKIDAAGTIALDAGGGQVRNVLCLAFDKTKRLLAGTDGTGMVLRLDADKKLVVLHEAGSALDITALQVDSRGNIYAAAAKSDLGSLGGLGGMGGMGDEGPKSGKPAKPETEPAEPPDEETTRPSSPPASKPAKQSRGPEAMPRIALADIAPPDALQQPLETFDLLENIERAEKTQAKSPPATRKKKPSSATSRMGKGRRRPMPRITSPMDEGEEAQAGVYRIAPDGDVINLVTGIEMPMSLLWQGDELIIGTGNEGKVYAYKPGDESQALVARVSQETITALAAGKDNTVYLGASNLGALYQLSANLATKGTYTSKALDALRPAEWGKVRLTCQAPAGATAVVETRSSNVRDEKQSRFWSDWQKLEVADGKSAVIPSPKARYLQYRVVLESTGVSPTVQSVRLSYQVPNLPPRIRTLTVEVDQVDAAAPIEQLEGAPMTHIAWEASDPNRDTLTYRLYYKPAKPEPDGKELWTPIARALRTTSYDWNTQAIPDGKYQVKIVATDAPDNSPEQAQSAARVSSTIVIDHTPPEIGELKTTVAADGKVTITGTAKDALSPVISVRYQIDGQGDWRPATPSDKIFDSLNEAFTVVTRPLPASGHRITIRATDSAGNTSYKAVTVK